MKTVRLLLFFILSFSFFCELSAQKSENEFRFGYSLTFPEFGNLNQKEHPSADQRGVRFLQIAFGMGANFNGQLIKNHRWRFLFGLGAKFRTYSVDSYKRLSDWQVFLELDKQIEFPDIGYSLRTMSINNFYLTLPLGVKFYTRKNSAAKFQLYFSGRFVPHFKIATILSPTYERTTPFDNFGAFVKRNSSINNEIKDEYKSYLKNVVLAVFPALGFEVGDKQYGFELAFPTYLSQFDKELTDQNIGIQFSFRMPLRKETKVESGDNNLF